MANNVIDSSLVVNPKGVPSPLDSKELAPLPMSSVPGLPSSPSAETTCNEPPSDAQDTTKQVADDHKPSDDLQLARCANAPGNEDESYGGYSCLRVSNSNTPGDHSRSDSQALTSTADHPRQSSSNQLESLIPELPALPHRCSVQFAQDTSGNELPLDGSRPSSVLDDDDVDTRLKGKQSLFTKLRAFAGPPFSSYGRPVSGATIGDSRQSGSSHATPGSERGDSYFPNTLVEEGSDIDADGEESGGEQRTGLREKKKRRQQQLHDDSAPQTAPTTPKTPTRPPFYLPASFASFENYRPYFLPRRASAADIHQHRDGVSEDEGRDRLTRDTTWRRRSTWLANTRGTDHIGRAQEGHEEKRPSNLRRLTGFAGPSDNADAPTGPWRRNRADRHPSLSAQRWRQIKAGLKLIGQRRKTESTVDHAKSAELLAELTSGVPAALILASMFQRDEHGSKRIPILLEQLKVRVTDSKIDSHSGDRHLVFRIELEYGSGMTRMKWIIHRTLKDFANLHLKYKLHFGTQKYIQLRGSETGQNFPRFPRGAFPYLRGVRGLDSDMEDDEDEVGYETTELASGTDRTGRKKKRQHQHGRSFSDLSRRRPSATGPQELEGTTEPPGTSETGPAGRRDTYPERQRRKLEIYLQKMIRFLIFRPDSNRLCKFLELSALGVRLAAEGSYHGKEGFLIIQSSKGLDFRRAFTPALIKARHAPKWFLVRHSYVVCVDSPEEMNIYDVFLVDQFFRIQCQRVSFRNQNPKELARSAKDSARHPKHHTLRLQNSERRLRLLARNERQLYQFDDSIRFMVSNSPWSKPNRFDSFAPVRQNCFAQWLVDARDHMWVMSRAINQAKDVIYIHDWWLSPELYMRRPAAISQKWRLDRLLQRKAREGVKVFVIMYRNINSAIPIDSEYSKFSLLDLHPNIFVQRSPNQFRQNTFFWAHHEKLCLIDHTLAFVGGIDLCFGRWDTPQHPLTDDKPTGFESTGMPKDADHCQLWPGKDYSNPRVQDFYDLDKPYEEMYDRSVIPRMPWHDISMHVVGQPARDLTRHFVQRWNYILRQRKPTRPTPFLLPPPDFEAADLEALGLDGTCEVQILRSSSMWSTGTPDVTEHSILNAYVKLIAESDHFVYIENQFFISSCEIDGRKIENSIGDALVDRITRAARNGETWRAVILIPLMPGFQNTVDSEGGTSVRLIMQCQYRSICRGETSIFGKLRALGIDPEDYIQFFSLRSWGKIGPQKQLVTEQLYIHAKCIVVDDRAAIIGSANINERSMLGSRDSEVAAVVRDTDLIWSTMNGRPYLVGRFPHTLRMRLMREHLGIDVDELMEHDIATEEQLLKIQVAEEDRQSHEDGKRPDSESLVLERQDERDMIERRHRIQDEFLSRSEDLRSFNHDVDWEQGNNPNLKTNKKMTADPRVTGNAEHKKDVDGDGLDNLSSAIRAGIADGRDSKFLHSNKEVLVSPIASEGRGALKRSSRSLNWTLQKENAGDKETGQHLSSSGPNSADPSPTEGHTPALHAISEGDVGTSSTTLSTSKDEAVTYPPALGTDLGHIYIDKDCMRDPVNDIFYLDTWLALAEKNTKIYRAVFRCMPDNEVKSWREYKEYAAYGERFAEMQSRNSSKAFKHSQLRRTGPPGTGSAYSPATLAKPNELRPSGSLTQQLTDEKGVRLQMSDSNHSMSSKPKLANGDQEAQSPLNEKFPVSQPNVPGPNKVPNSRGDDSGGIPLEDPEKSHQRSQLVDYSDALNRNARTKTLRRKKKAAGGSRREPQIFDEVMDAQQAENMLNNIQGHLILWPYDWLEKEEQGGNWLYTLDQISPLEIYN